MAKISSPLAAAENTAKQGSRRRKETLSYLFTAVAVTWTLACLCILRLLQAFRIGVLRIRQVRILRVVERYPGASLLACQAVALGLSSESVRERASASPVVPGLVLSLWVALLVLLRFACIVFDQYPATLAEIGRRSRQHWPERYFAARMRNPIDAYFVRSIIYSSLTMIPAWVILLHANFLPEMNYVFFGVSYMAGSGRHEIFDHTNIHNRLFRCRRGLGRVDRFVFRLINFYVDYVLSMLFLRMPFFYKTQHAHIHHLENNGIDDTQSTLPYDRCSFIDFCRFAGGFALDFTTAARTIAYLVWRRRYRLLRLVVRGVALWYGALALIFWFNPMAALFLWCLKFFSQVSAALTSYAWHVFADPDDPQNVFRNSVDIVMFDGHGGLGASPHIEHHCHSGLHWSKIAAVTAQRSREHETEGALRWYDPTSYYYALRAILQALWSDRLDAIEPLFASYNKTIPDKAALMEVLRARTRPAVACWRSPAFARFDRWLGAVAARYLMGDPLPPADFRTMLPRRRSRTTAPEAPGS